MNLLLPPTPPPITRLPDMHLPSHLFSTSFFSPSSPSLPFLLNNCGIDYNAYLYNEYRIIVTIIIVIIISVVFVIIVIIVIYLSIC